MPILLDGTNGITTPTVTYEGNVVISGTARRIIGDFSNATTSNRVAFQTSTTNGVTVLTAYPNGTGTTTGLNLYNGTDPLNSNISQLGITATDTRIAATAVGTATALPMIFLTGGSERLRIDTSGRVLINSTAVPNGNFLVNNGTDKNVQIRGGIRLTGSSIQSIQNNLATDSPLEIYVGSAQLQLEGTPVTFLTSGIERMRITSGGNVGIGTTTPQSTLDLGIGSQSYNPTYVGQLRIGQTGNPFITNTGGIEFLASSFQNGYGYRIVSADEGGGSTPLIFLSRLNTATWTESMRLTVGGSLLVGTTTARGRISSTPRGDFAPQINAGSWANSVGISTSGGFGGGFSWIDGSGGYCAWVDDGGTDFNIAGASTSNTVGNGVFLNGYSATSWSGRSDERLKDKLEPIVDAVNKVSSLRAVTGVYKDYPDDRQAFLIAQDVQAVLPEAVSVADKRSPEQYLGLAYTQVIPLLVAAIQEQQVIIETLKSRLDAAGL
jgi:hypothetical protein